jgi:hypothetical protein
MGNVVSSEQNSNEEGIGSALFEKVRSFHEENAEKITGMLLEMPPKDLQNIFADDTKLMSQIYEAIKILDYETELAKLESLGDVLYPEVEAVYSEHEIAEKITGMLLELNVDEIERLMQNKSELLVKIHEAFAVLQRHSDNELKRCEVYILTQTQSHTQSTVIFSYATPPPHSTLPSQITTLHKSPPL